MAIFFVAILMFVGHLAMVMKLMMDEKRMGALAGDKPQDALHSPMKTAAAYGLVFGCQFWGLGQMFLSLKGAAHLPISEGTFALGCYIFFLGAVLRIWSIRVLGRHFTMTLGVRQDHKLVETGPYKLIRHPSYTGYLFMIAGIGIAYQSWVSLFIPLIMTLVFQVVRMNEEEKMLVSALGQPYEAYMKRTKRLIPFVY